MSVAVSADADAVGLPIEFAPWAFARGAGVRELRVGVGVASVAVADGVDAVAVPGFWSWAAVSGATLDDRQSRSCHGSTTWQSWSSLFAPNVGDDATRGLPPVAVEDVAAVQEAQSEFRLRGRERDCPIPTSPQRLLTVALRLNPLRGFPSLRSVTGGRRPAKARLRGDGEDTARSRSKGCTDVQQRENEAEAGSGQTVPGEAGGDERSPAPGRSGSCA